MLDASTRPLPAFNHGELQFYHIEICPLADGMLAVAITATMCPCEGELTTQELHHQRTKTLDQALAVIKESVLLQ